MKFSKIKDNDIANGLGITMSLWTQGCPHHCKGCFNEKRGILKVEKCSQKMI